MDQSINHIEQKDEIIADTGNPPSQDKELFANLSEDQIVIDDYKTPKRWTKKKGDKSFIEKNKDLFDTNNIKHANLLVNQLRNGKIEKKYLDISTQRDIIEFEDGTKLASFNLKNYRDWIITKTNKNTDNEGSLDVLWTDSHFCNPFVDKKYWQDLLALEHASMEDGQPTNHVNRGIKFIDGEELDFSTDPVLITGLQENSWEEALMYIKKKGGDSGVIVEGSFHRRGRFQLISEEKVPVKDFLIREN